MLRARIYVNIDELEDIQIVNVRNIDTRGETKYQVYTLNGPFTVYHRKADGWIKLLIKVLKGIENRGLKLETIEEDISPGSRSLNKEEEKRSKKKCDKIFDEVVDSIIERNIGAYKKLKDL